MFACPNLWCFQMPWGIFRYFNGKRESAPTANPQTELHCQPLPEHQQESAPLGTGTAQTDTRPEPVVTAESASAGERQLNDPSLDWHPKKPQTWSEAVEEWRNKNQERYAELGKIIKTNRDSGRSEPSDKLLNQTTARLKEWLPSLAAVRGIAMSVAATDPYKIAPIICASIFFSIEIVFNKMSPEDSNNILDILCNCNKVIQECISIETKFSMKSNHPAIEKRMTTIKQLLFDQYIRTLGLMADIYHCSEDTRVRSIWNKLSNKILDWKSKASEINRAEICLLEEAKAMELALSSDAEITKILAWVKKESDPEPKLDTIKQRVMPDGNYKESGRWFLNSPEFLDWSQSQESLESSETQGTSKRVLWVKGALGTGKTTLLYQAYSYLETSFQNQTGRIIQYFCDASNTSKRPDYETVIRSMACRLSLIEDTAIDAETSTMYNFYNSAAGQERIPGPNDWEQLLESLITKYTKGYQIMFLVDALDECEEVDIGRLLQFMKKVVNDHPNIRFLCTSHLQVRMDLYFSSDVLQDLEVTKEKTEHEMDSFIKGEIERRKENAMSSIFSTCQRLREELRDTLIKSADGMFLWVTIWLDILLPTHTFSDSIQTENEAKRMLTELRDDAQGDGGKRLESGYQRLWDMNDLRGFAVTRKRLFHLVLSTPLPAAIILEALCISKVSINHDVTDKIFEKLYSNFLYDSGNEGLRFVHDSARRFIENMPDSDKNDAKLFSKKKNNLDIANLYIDVMELHDHPCWNHYYYESTKKYRYGASSWENVDYKSILVYLSIHGLKHCYHAAERQSMSDELWTRIMDCVIIPSNSAFYSKTDLICTFGKISARDKAITFKNRDNDNQFFYPHLLAFLNIIDESYFSRFDDSNFTQEESARHDFFFSGKIDSILQRLGSNWGVSVQLTHTALEIACMSDNAAAVKTILNTMYLQCPDHYFRYWLILKAGEEFHPVSLALDSRNLEILKILLDYDRKKPIVPLFLTGKMENRAFRESRKTDLWSTYKITPTSNKEPVLKVAIETFEEREILSLLSIISPRNEHVNHRNPYGHTAIDAAIKRGFRKLAKELVEKYGARRSQAYDRLIGHSDDN